MSWSEPHNLIWVGALVAVVALVAFGRVSFTLKRTNGTRRFYLRIRSLRR